MVRQWHLNIGAMALFAVGLTALFFSSVGDSYAAPSLVVNGGFATTVNNFTGDANISLAWDGAQDVQNDPNSGSAVATYIGAVEGDGRIDADCITISGVAIYPYSAFAKAGSQWTHTGSVATSSYVNLQMDQYISANCSGPSFATTSHGQTLVGNPGDGWVQLAGNLNVVDASVLTVRVALVVHGEVQNDDVTWDEVGLAFQALDTPTPFPTSTATATATATITNTPTNTPTATNTPAATATSTGTPEPTETPFPTHTPTGTSTTVPTNTSTPEPIVEEVVDDTGAPPEADLEGGLEDGVGAGGESPEQGVGAGGEQPEGQEFPSSGTGPGSYGNDDSTPANVIATFAFALAIGMLGTGFYLRKKYEESE
jgi:hypothetical protein